MFGFAGFTKLLYYFSDVILPFVLPLQKCGLRKLIYLVEADPNTDAPKSAKTAYVHCS
jgi:hypothetical protein